MKNIELNQLSNVTVFPFALGNAKSRAALHLGNLTNPGVNSLNVLSQSNGSVEVSIERADEIISSNQMELAKLIKLDVEGHEWPALQGLENLWQNCAAALLIEMNEDKEKIYAHLEARGYTTAESLQPTLQYDALFVKK
jgi:FkbM family methyltransferase